MYFKIIIYDIFVEHTMYVYVPTSPKLKSMFRNYDDFVIWQQTGFIY